jgi:hypothetical protein
VKSIERELELTRDSDIFVTCRGRRDYTCSSRNGYAGDIRSGLD